MTSDAEAASILDALFSPFQLKVYDTIIRDGPATRDELVQKLWRPRTTIFEALIFLEKRGLVARRPIYSADHERGRPRVEFYLAGRDDRS